MLSMKNARPWRIVCNIDNKAYELDIPQQMRDVRLALIFHPWKLHLALNNLFSGQILKPRPPVLVSSSNKNKTHEKWEVLKMVDLQKQKKVWSSIQGHLHG